VFGVCKVRQKGVWMNQIDQIDQIELIERIDQNDQKLAGPPAR